MCRDRQLEAVTPRTVIRFCGVFKVVIGGTGGMKRVVRRDLRLQFSLLLLLHGIFLPSLNSQISAGLWFLRILHDLRGSTSRGV